MYHGYLCKIFPFLICIYSCYYLDKYDSCLRQNSTSSLPHHFFKPNLMMLIV